jgi:hypothetical protein
MGTGVLRVRPDRPTHVRDGTLDVVDVEAQQAFLVQRRFELGVDRDRFKKSDSALTRLPLRWAMTPRLYHPYMSQAVV